MSYVDQLIAVIKAPDHIAKGQLLAHIKPPAAEETWPTVPIPTRPGRLPGTQETQKPARRRKGLQDKHTRLRFFHAIHQIELSAVDLACLLCLRASGMPQALHADHLSVARDEAIHAGLLHDYLCEHGYPPGSEPVHFRLWDSACAAESIGEQLVVIPRFLEARGLDVTAEMLPRIADIDTQAHAVLHRIYHDELRHVEIGTRWHRYWCQQQSIDPLDHFTAVCLQHFPDQVPGPIELDRPGRMTAGFWPSELDFLETGIAEKPNENG